MPVTQEQISAAIGSITDPYLGIDLVAANAIKGIKVDGNSVHVDIELGFPVTRYAAELENVLRPPIAALAENLAIDFDIRSKIVAHTVQTGAKRLTEVRNIIAVASGKAVLVNLRRRRTWHSLCAMKVLALRFSMPIYTVPVNHECSERKASRNRATASRWSQS